MDEEIKPIPIPSDLTESNLETTLKEIRALVERADLLSIIPTSYLTVGLTSTEHACALEMLARTRAQLLSRKL